MKILEVLFSPPEFAALQQRDLGKSTCVVFDILRATTSMMMALANGATGMIPVTQISEAIALREKNGGILLAGERDGLRIRAALTGSIDFDFGNSPQEFTSDRVRGKRIAITTTNGTRALQACAGAKTILIGSFLNLQPLANWLAEHSPDHLILVCSGTHEQAALEDTLAAGALCEKIWTHYADEAVADSAEIARGLYSSMKSDLLGAMSHSQNGRRLLANDALRSDVAFCVQRETLSFIAECKDGVVQKI